MLVHWFHVDALLLLWSLLLCWYTSAAHYCSGTAPVSDQRSTMEQQEAPDFSVDTVKLYLAEEGVTAASRIRSKILGTGILVPPPSPTRCHSQQHLLTCCLLVWIAAAVTAVGTTLWATATNRCALAEVCSSSSNNSRGSNGIPGSRPVFHAALETASL
jgi:hypothetical protein